MVGRTSSRNTTQRAGKINRVAGRIVSAPTGIYTVPDDTEARITDIIGILDAVGADATYAIAYLRDTVYTEITTFKAAGEEMRASAIVLQAGDILTNIGDSGSTNGTFDLQATIEEFGV